MLCATTIPTAAREGLLEFMGDDDDYPPIGWLTAEEALVLFEEELKGEENILENEG